MVEVNGESVFNPLYGDTGAKRRIYPQPATEPSVKRTIPVIAIYPESGISLTITTSSTTITVDDGIASYGPITYTNLTIDQLCSQINTTAAKVTAIRLLDAGREKLISGALMSSNSDRHGDGAYLIRYTGFAIRYREDSVIQLKPPENVGPLVSWYPRIGRGEVRVRFTDISPGSFPGITPNAIYTFSVPEYIDQEWSLQYGAPYKDVIGEIPQIMRYNSTNSTTILRVANRPIYWRNKNISITIRGVRQPTSIIKYVDENNGLIYLSTKLNSNTPLNIDYSYKEEYYLYDAVDLNPTTSHNPAIIDTFVAFYLKPTSAEGAIISGGQSVFHEILNTSIAGRTKTIRMIDQSIGRPNPLYEPVLYLGSVSVRQGKTDDVEIIDTRTRGGGLHPHEVEDTRQRWREAEYFWDIGSIDGVPIPGNGGVIINLPDYLKTSGMPRDEIRERATRTIVLGNVAIVDGFES
jgi:hypothetical protein